MANVKKKIPHKRIVDDILPQCAQKLKRDKVISGWDRHRKVKFRIQIGDSEPATIIPDLLVYLDSRRKRRVLVEVANPKDPKRYVGEMIYPHLLGSLREIEAAIILVLPRKDELLDRTMVLELTLNSFLKKQIPSKPIPLRNPKDREEIYLALHDYLDNYKSFGDFDFSL